MMDIDLFTSINDKYGRDAGDKAPARAALLRCVKKVMADGSTCSDNRWQLPHSSSDDFVEMSSEAA